MDWTNEILPALSAQNQHLLKEAKALESAEHNVQELVNQANDFARKRLSIFKALEVV